MKIVFYRDPLSYDHKIDPKRSDYDNNRKRVYFDRCRILDDQGGVILELPCQTVAIHPRWSSRESIAPGTFRVRCFAPQRDFKNPVHEVINACDLEGEPIDRNAMQLDKQSGWVGRYLIHDDYNPRTGKAYSAPWSAGCPMFRWQDYPRFNDALLAAGCEAGTEIEAELIEGLP